MAEATTIYGNALKLDVFLYEGVFTRRDVWRDDGKIIKAGTFSAEIKKGDILQVYTDSWSTSAASIVVAKQDRDTVLPTVSGFSGALAYLITAPSGKIPDVAADGGSFTASKAGDLRQGTVIFPGFSAVIAGKIGDGSKAGALLGWDSSLAQYTTNSASVSYRPYVLLQSASAGGTASVLLGGGQ